jgi:hypothetical protein
MIYCPNCGGLVPEPRMKPRRFCSDACKVAAHRKVRRIIKRINGEATFSTSADFSSDALSGGVLADNAAQGGERKG